MSKKLKITEGQLKKLMERKHSYTDNSAESAIVKPEEGEVDELVTPLHMWLQDKGQDKSKGAGLKTDIVALLQELGDYMENRADVAADSDDGRQGNEEMRFLSDINDILYKLGAGPDTSGRSAVDANYKPHEGPIGEESKFGMGDGESLDEIADDLTRCHNDLSDLSSTMEQLTYAIDGNEKLADVSEQFDAAYVKVTEALDDVSNVLSLVQEVAEREGEGDEEEYDDEEGGEEDEMMNESIKAIKANFKRFL